MILTFGLLWTTAPIYGLRKLIRYIGLGIPLLLLPTLIIRTQKDGVNLLYIFITISLITAFILLFFPQTSLEVNRYGNYYGRKTFIGSDPNTPAVVVLMGLQTFLIVMFSGFGRNWLKYIGLIAFPILFLALLSTGSRAAFIAFIISFIFIVSIYKNLLKVSGVVLVLLFISIIIIKIAIPDVSKNIPVDRWWKLSHQIGEGNFKTTRTPAWEFCIRHSWDKHILLGHGPGSFAFDFKKIDMPVWPHNILLESLYESGLVGFIAMFIFIIICIKILIVYINKTNNINDRLVMVNISSIFISLLIMALTHWDIDGSRFMYLFVGIIHAYYDNVIVGIA
jgi:O-antigen ligase